MFEIIWYEVDKYEIPLRLSKSVLSPFLWIGTLMDSFQSCGNSSLLQLKTMGLCVSSYNLPKRTKKF